MDDQRVGRAIGVLRAGHVAPLQAVLRVDHCVLIGSFSDGQALQADAQTCLVHHGEHGAHAFVLGAQQIAGRLVIVHHAGRVAVDAHLFSSILPTETPLRAPSEPSSFTTNFGTINSETPLIPSGPPGIFASTKWMMLSDMS